MRPDGSSDGPKRSEQSKAARLGSPTAADRVGSPRGEQFSLLSMYWHFNIGCKEEMIIDMSTIDFSGTSQKVSGISGMEIGRRTPVNLFQAGPFNQAALAFGRVYMQYHGNDRYSIVGDDQSRFDFLPLIDEKASVQRNVGNVLGAIINHNVWMLGISARPLVSTLTVNGSYPVSFVGTTYIKK